MKKRHNPLQKTKRIRLFIKIHSVLMLVIAVLLCSISFAFALHEDKISDTLTVGVPVDRCPVFYCDTDTNEIVGIGTELMRIAAKEAGFNVTYHAIEEESLKDALDNEAYDVIIPFGSAITSKEGKSSIVSDNLFQTPFTLVTLSDKQLPQINDLKIGMLNSLAGGAETVCKLYTGVEITFFDTMDESVKALRNGKVDALLHNSYVWSYVLQKPSYSDLSVQPSAMFSMDFRVGTLDTPTGQEIISRLNNGIAAMTDTQRQAVILDYTTRKLYHYDMGDYLYEQWKFLLLICLLITALIIIAVQRVRTIRSEQEEKMRQLIDKDALTGALSLNGFRKRVEELLREYPNAPYLLCYSNIRNFKFINDSLGMEAGDELLRFWAEQTMKVMTDMDVFGRIEADHFAVLRYVTGDELFKKDNSTIFEPLRNFFINRNKEMRVQICTGVYMLKAADYQNINVDQMLDYARVAEKRLRGDHNDGFEFYNIEHWKTGKMIVDITSRLSTALQSGEIQVWYQPQVNFETDKIIGAEALCRWNHAKQGRISPSDFIPALEEAGLIYDLDCYVWETVCKDLQRWNTEGKCLTVSVNLSRADFAKNPDLPEHFRDLITTYNLTPKQLHLEITETAYVENPELLIATTQKFREYGFLVEMDDFGSGYSSLNMLKEVQVDRVKLDLHFLTETGDQEKGRIIVQHMIQMTHSLGMGIIAEGVERKEQAKFLRELGCTDMQGFYYYKPMPYDEYTKLIDKNM